MTWRNWNCADKVLLCAAVVFLFSLCLHLQYPDSLFSEGFMFCAEAALVGGIADWFAVTALFRKPLGFPYHTALLPKRRQAFIQASVDMIQKEFFSKKKILRWVKGFQLPLKLMEWLEQPVNQEKVMRAVLHYLRRNLFKENPQEMSASFAEKLRQFIIGIPAQEIFFWCVTWLRENGMDKKMLAMLAGRVKKQAELPETRLAIERKLEEYKQEQVQSPLAMLMGGLAELFNLVNLEEASGLIQKKVLQFLDELADENSDLQQRILAICYERAEIIGRDKEFCQVLMEWKAEIAKELPLEEAVNGAVGYVCQHICEEKQMAEGKESEPEAFALLFQEEYTRIFQLIRTDAGLSRSVEHFIYDVVMRSALQAQSMIGVVVKDVLGRLTDEQLNRMVYDKVETDLLWIRMNGSVVGASIGLLIFAILKLAGEMV